MLPASLVQPVIVKNTFLDFDDTCLGRSSRRCKTEGAIKLESDVELYDQKRRRVHKIEGAIDVKSVKELYNDSDDSTSTCSPASSYCRCSSNSSSPEQRPSIEDIALQSQKDRQSSQQRKPVMLLSEVIPSSVAISTVASCPSPKVHHWAIDAKKLRSNDRSVVSRPFTLPIGAPGSEGVTCKMMLYARTLNMGKAGHSFKLSGGQGNLQLKCEQDLRGLTKGRVSLRFSIGNGQVSKLVVHDFSQSAACASPDWDFGSAIDKSSNTLVVSVEVVTV